MPVLTGHLSENSLPAAGLSCCTADTMPASPFPVVAPLAFLSFFYGMATRQTPLWFIYINTLAGIWAVSGLGYLTSILFSFNDAQLMGIVEVLIFCMSGGTTPTLKTVESTLPGTIAAASSFARWMSESFVGRELQTYPQSRKEEADLLMEHFGYKYANVWPALGWLALIGVIFRLLSLIVLFLKDRDKQA